MSGLDQSPAPGRPAAVPPHPAPPRPRPLDPPMVPFAVAGTVAWVLVGLVLLPFRHTLAERGDTWWLWMCLAGVLLGLLGLALMIRHDAGRRARTGRAGS